MVAPWEENVAYYTCPELFNRKEASKPPLGAAPEAWSLETDGPGWPSRGPVLPPDTSLFAGSQECGSLLQLPLKISQGQAWF